MARPCKKNPRGEQVKRKQTTEVITLLKQAFSIGCTDVEACLHAGIATSTYYEWKKDDPKLSEEFDRLKQSPVMKARNTIVEGLDDVANARWYLERKRKDEFSPRVENTGADGEPLSVEISFVTPPGKT